MVFNSLTYLLFFPLTVLLYFLIPQKLKNSWLLVTSFAFYAYWSLKYAFLLLGLTVISYFCARLMEKRTGTARKWICTASVVLVLAVLFFFKYTGFAAETCNSLLGLMNAGWVFRVPSLILPIGISFYTFQIVGYLIDVYRDTISAEKDFISYALFVLFFPKLIEGPIERYDHMRDQFAQPKSFEWDRFVDGTLLMLWGYFMKMVIADRAAVFVDSVYSAEEAAGSAILFATVLYGFQIYCDFAGYSLIAIGSAKILGFELMENFRAPYLAVSVKDFWRRWHISLNKWLRDYVYIPLGGSHGSRAAYHRNLMITFLISGLWHGASWNFVVWGGLNGLFQIVEDILGSVYKRSSEHAVQLPGIVFWKRVLTFVLVDFAWLFFRARNLTDAMHKIRAMVLRPQWTALSAPEIYSYGLNLKNLRLLIGSIALVIVCDLLNERGIVIREKIHAQFWLNRILIISGAILFIIVFGIWGSGYDAASFIYTSF